MSFFWLLIIVLFAIAVSWLMIWRSAKATRANTNTNTSQGHTVADDEDLSTGSQQSKQIDMAELPNLFQQLIIDIEQQYFASQHKQDGNNIEGGDGLTDELCFNMHKLFYQRLPEIVENYLQLDSQRARTDIIDQQRQLTSYDMTLQQLKSVLTYFYQVNYHRNNKHVQNILINDRYLQQVYGADYIGAHTTNRTLKTVLNTASNKALNKNMPSQTTGIELGVGEEKQRFFDTDFLTGQQYIDDYCALTDSEQAMLSNEFLVAIGKLVYLAIMTQLAIESYLENKLEQLNISSDYGLESLESLLVVKLPAELTKLLQLQAKLKQEEQQQQQNAKLTDYFTKLSEQLELMLKTLDKDIRLDIKLHQLQSIDDDIWKIVDSEWQINTVQSNNQFTNQPNEQASRQPICR